MRGLLVGRDQLLARAAALLDGGSRGLVLVGEGGVGKSRIAAEVARLGAERGLHVVSTIGTQSAASIPLGALSHLLPDLTAPNANLLAAARRTLEDQAGGRRVLLWADDAHLLDDHSATLLLQLAVAMSGFVLATIRTGEVVPDPLTALWKDGLAERLEVGRLPDTAIEALAADLLGAPLGRGLAAALTARSDGNAMVARELCLAGRDGNAIALVDGRNQLVGDLPISARLVELVRGRLDGLAAPERRAIELVAHGEPMGMDAVRDLAGFDALVALEGRGLVALRMDGRRREVWLAHPIYGEVIRATTGPLRAGATKGRLAERIAATGMRRRSDLLRVATWQLDAGTADPSLLERAATEAYHGGDMPGTARLAAGAWDARPTPASGQLLATALAYSGRWDQADAVFAGAAELATDSPTRTRLAVVHAALLSTGMGRPDAAIALLTEAEAGADSHEERAHLRAQRALLLALGGEVDAALGLAEPLLAGVDAGPVLVAAAMTAAIAQEFAGRHETVIEVARRALPETSRLWSVGQSSIPPQMLELQAYGARVSMGALDAPPPAADGAGAAEPGSLLRPVALLRAVHLGAAALEQGRPRSAIAVLERVEPDATDLLATTALAGVACAHALLGDADRARAALEQVRRWRRPGTIFNPLLASAEVWTLVAAGDPEAARRAARAAIAEAEAAGRRALALRIAHALARIGGVGEAREAMRRLDSTVDGIWAKTAALHVEGVAADDPAVLEDAAARFEAMGARLVAAEAAAAAARAWRRAGDARRGTRLAQRAAALAVGCEGARTPSLALPEAELTPLSRRELEIARMAASGLSSEEIGRRLFLSVRTVDNHLGHVYQKLGIGSRGELRAALHPE